MNTERVAAMLGGRLALVTGASSGIGEAVARRLGDAGCRVIAVARREERLRDLVATLPQGSTGVAADLRDPSTPGRLREAVDAAGGDLHLLVNNAGAGAGTGRAPHFGDVGAGDVEDLMELNFLSHVRVVAALLPAVRRAAPSAVVNVSSVSGRVGLGGATAYAASKFAMTGFTEALHCEEAPHGVHVACVFPGFATTEGFPQTDLMARRATRWMVTDAATVADAVIDAAVRRRPERTVPRAYAAVDVVRTVAPALWWRVAERLRR